MLDDSANARLVDFGAARDGAHVMTRSVQGTPAYMAPEVVGGRMHSATASDVWSLGVLLFAMLSKGAFPYWGRDFAELQRNLTSREFAMPKDASASCRDLLSKMLNKSPAKRITIAAVKAHAYTKAGMPAPQPVPAPQSMPVQEPPAQPLEQPAAEPAREPQQPAAQSPRGGSRYVVERTSPEPADDELPPWQRSDAGRNNNFRAPAESQPRHNNYSASHNNIFGGEPQQQRAAQKSFNQESAGRNYMSPLAHLMSHNGNAARPVSAGVGARTPVDERSEYCASMSSHYAGSRQGSVSSRLW